MGMMSWFKKPGLGLLLLAVWLIATGLFHLLKVSFQWQDIVMAVLAVAAGVLLLFNR